MTGHRGTRPRHALRALLTLPPPPSGSPVFSQYPFELLRIRRLGPLLPSVQIIAVAALYVATTLLFGLWHLKNLFWMTDAALAQQITYTALVFGPLTAWLALRLRTIWPGVMLHYLNNMPVELLPF